VDFTSKKQAFSDSGRSVHKHGTVNEQLARIRRCHTRKNATAEQVTCIGIETIDGTNYYADKVVLAAGV